MDPVPLVIGQRGQTINTASLGVYGLWADLDRIFFFSSLLSISFYVVQVQGTRPACRVTVSSVHIQGRIYITVGAGAGSGVGTGPGLDRVPLMK